MQIVWSHVDPKFAVVYAVQDGGLPPLPVPW